MVGFLNRYRYDNIFFLRYSLFEQKRDASNPVVVPERYRHKGHFWWASNLLSFLLATPNHDLQLHLESSKKAAGWSRMKRPMLSMHVRHGDTCTLAEEDYTKRRCEPLSVYLEDAVLPMSRRWVEFFCRVFCRFFCVTELQTRRSIRLQI